MTDFELVETALLVLSYGVNAKGREVGTVNREITVEGEWGERWTGKLHVPVLVLASKHRLGLPWLLRGGFSVLYDTPREAAEAVVRTFERENKRENDDHSYHTDMHGIEAA